ncbi:PIN domain-containing protein [Pseudomonas syringae group genomosp. 3]|nr:PIN domain-containing protein [Pseudomonas syringae group genomosp. 3]
MPLQTRNVFIDTEFFVKAGLDFSSKTLESFKDICNKDELKHITSTIVVREVKRKIEEHIGEALNGVNAFRRKARILTNSKDKVIKNLFVPFDQEQIQNHAIQVFDRFLDESGTTVVDLSKVDGNKIVEMYFNQTAPFQGGKKKNEFPDAFTLLAVKASLKGREEIYVVSEDKDLITFCDENPRFIQIDSLNKLLDLYNSHDEDRFKFIKSYLDENERSITNKIKKQIEDAEAENVSTWEDSEVDEFSILDVSGFEPSIIHIDDEECQIVFDVEVHYKVKVTGPDYVNGRYDKEDDVIYTFDETTQEEEGALTFPVEVDLSYEVDCGEFIIRGMEINVQGLSGGIEFSVEESPYEHCK